MMGIRDGWPPAAGALPRRVAWRYVGGCSASGEGWSTSGPDSAWPNDGSPGTPDSLCVSFADRASLPPFAASMSRADVWRKYCRLWPFRVLHLVKKDDPGRSFAAAGRCRKRIHLRNRSTWCGNSVYVYKIKRISRDPRDVRGRSPACDSGRRIWREAEGPAILRPHITSIIPKSCREGNPRGSFISSLRRR